MKKIFFAALMLVTMGGITYAQTTPAKTSSAQKKEVTKKASTSSVSSVSPVNTTKNPAASTKTKTTTKTSTKPATTAAAPNQKIPASAIGKHKKHHTAKKKANKK